MDLSSKQTFLSILLTVLAANGPDALLVFVNTIKSQVWRSFPQTFIQFDHQIKTDQHKWIKGVVATCTARVPQIVIDAAGNNPFALLGPSLKKAYAWAGTAFRK